MASPCCVCNRDLDQPGPGGFPVNRVDVGGGRLACAGCAPKASKTAVQMRSYGGKVQRMRERH